jgi:HK97 family phage portal protein
LYIHSKGGGRVKAVFNPLFRVIQNPSIEESPTLFYNTLIKHILHYGNGYLFKLRDSKNSIIGLQLIHPETIQVRRDSIGRKVFCIGANQYTSNEVIHIPNKNNYDGTLGHSPRETANRYILLDNVLTEYIHNYFQFSAGKRLILTLNKENSDSKDADKAYIKLIEWVNKYIVGAQNAGKPLISPPNGTLTPINQTSNADSDLASLKQSTEKAIADFYSVPYSVLQEVNTYNSLEQRQKNFILQTIKPLGLHIAETLTNSLLSPLEQNQTLFFAYDFTDLIEADIKVQLEYLSKGILSGVFTNNEARARLGLDSMGDIGDYHYLPVNYFPITQENIEAFFAASKALIESGKLPNSNPGSPGSDKE